MKRAAVVGSRHFGDKELVEELIDRLFFEHPEIVIASGGAEGVDTWAEEKCNSLGIPMEIFLPSEGPREPRGAFRYHCTGPTNLSFGKRCYERNKRIALWVKEDTDGKVFAFWDGKSPGTKMVIHLCDRLAVPVEVIYPRVEKAPGFKERARAKVIEVLLEPRGAYHRPAGDREMHRALGYLGCNRTQIEYTLSLLESEGVIRKHISRGKVTWWAGEKMPPAPNRRAADVSEYGEMDDGDEGSAAKIPGPGQAGDDDKVSGKGSGDRVGAGGQQAAGTDDGESGDTDSPDMGSRVPEGGEIDDDRMDKSGGDGGGAQGSSGVRGDEEQIGGDNLDTGGDGLREAGRGQQEQEVPPVVAPGGERGLRADAEAVCDQSQNTLTPPKRPAETNITDRNSIRLRDSIARFRRAAERARDERYGWLWSEDDTAVTVSHHNLRTGKVETATYRFDTGECSCPAQEYSRHWCKHRIERERRAECRRRGVDYWSEEGLKVTGLEAPAGGVK